MRRILANLALVVGSLAMSLLAIEGFLRVWNPFETRIQADSIILPVNRRYEIRRTTDGVTSTVIHAKNGLGFRGPDWPSDPGQWRKWFFVGGSTTEEFYLPNGETWPERVAARLADHVDRLWVNNAGLDGHSSFGHTVLLNDYLIGLKPQTIFFLVGINDVGNDVPVRFDQRLRPDWADRPGLAELTHWLNNRTEVGRLAQLVMRKIRSKQLNAGYDTIDVRRLRLRTDWPVPPAAVEGLLDDHRRRYLPGFRDRMAGLARTCRDNDIQPVFITQPMLFGDAIDPATGIDLGRVMIEAHSGFEHRLLLELYNDVTRDIAASQGIPLIDLARLMPQDSRLFTDMVHFTDAGDRRVADIVSQFLIGHPELH